jgi:DHA1 family multidrug resistance protein-like MFS transporter
MCRYGTETTTFNYTSDVLVPAGDDPGEHRWQYVPASRTDLPDGTGRKRGAGRAGFHADLGGGAGTSNCRGVDFRHDWPAAGHCDRLDRRGAGFLAMLLAPSWPWMLLALSITQIPYALVGPSFSAFIAENSLPENRGRVYGITDMIYQVVGIVGPPLGGALAGAFGFKVMLLVATLFYTAAAGLRIWMARTMHSAGERETQPLTVAAFKDSAKLVSGMIMGGGLITWIFLTDGVRDVAFQLSGELEPLYLDQVIGLGLGQIGLLGSFFSIAMVLTPVISGKLADRYGERVPIAAGFLVMFGAYMVFLQARAYPTFILTWVLFGLGVGLLSPAYQSLISKAVPQNTLGAFNGLFYGSMGLLSLPAPFLGAWIWERFNPRVPFMITAWVVLLSVVPIWLKFKLKGTTVSQNNA